MDLSKRAKRTFGALTLMTLVWGFYFVSELFMGKM